MDLRNHFGLCDRCETPVAESHRPLKLNGDYFCSDDCLYDFLENFPEVAIELVLENMMEVGVKKVSNDEIRGFLDMEKEKSDYDEHWKERQGDFLSV